MAVERFGGQNVIATSYTRTAAAVLAGKDLDLPKENVGTLHSFCYRALDRPKIAETKAAEFNALHPESSITGQQTDVDDAAEPVLGAANGDHALGSLQLLRSRMTPRELWPESVLSFATRWENWKREAGYLDFTDLIENCLESVDIAPGRPTVMFNDEAQDMSTLQYALVRKWANHMDHMVCLFDDDQLIQSFTGAEVRNLIDGECASSMVLAESYRLPRAVYSVARAWIEQCSHRMAKEWKPRDAEGSVERLNSCWKNPHGIVAEAQRCAADGKTVMILGACSYMLAPIVRELKEKGLLFHNPYRRTRGDWNPVRSGPGSALARIRAFLVGAGDLSPVWSTSALKLWVDLIDGKALLNRGAKKEIERMAEEDPARRLDHYEWMPFFKADPFGLDPATLDWLGENLKESKKAALAYPLRLVKENGIANVEKPKIIIGSIHSVKGGEADTVILLPDTSIEGDKEWRRDGEARDNVRRVFYVGMTRARQRLLVCNPSGATSVKLF